MKKSLLFLITLSGTLSLFSSCLATSFMVPNGSFITSGEVTSYASSVNSQKKGRACAISIIGLFAAGDASIEEAAYKSDIMNITEVSHEVEGILGFYQYVCTVVKGN